MDKNKMDQNKMEEKLKELQKHKLFLKLILDQSKRGAKGNLPFEKIQMMFDVIVRRKPCPSLEFLYNVEKTVLNWKNRRKTTREPSPDVISCLKEIEKHVSSLKTSLFRSSKPSTSQNATKSLNLQNTKEIIDTISLTSSDEDDDVEFVSIIQPASVNNSRGCDVLSKEESAKNEDSGGENKFIKKEEPPEIEEGEIIDNNSQSDLIAINILKEEERNSEINKLEFKIERTIEQKTDLNINNLSDNEVTIDNENANDQVEASCSISQLTDCLATSNKSKEHSTSIINCSEVIEGARNVEESASVDVETAKKVLPQKYEDSRNLVKTLEVAVLEVEKSAFSESETVSDRYQCSSLEKGGEVIRNNDSNKKLEGKEISTENAFECTKEAKDVDVDCQRQYVAVEEFNSNILNAPGPSSVVNEAHSETEKEDPIGGNETKLKKQSDISCCDNVRKEDKTETEVLIDNNLLETNDHSQDTTRESLISDKRVSCEDTTLSKKITKPVEFENNTPSSVQYKETIDGVENDSREKPEEVIAEQREENCEKIASTNQDVEANCLEFSEECDAQKDKSEEANNICEISTCEENSERGASINQPIEANFPEHLQNESDAQKDKDERVSNICEASIRSAENSSEIVIDVAETAKKECSEINWDKDFFSENSSEVITKTENEIAQSLKEDSKNEPNGDLNNSVAKPEVTDNCYETAKNIVKVSEESETDTAQNNKIKTIVLSDDVEQQKQLLSREDIGCDISRDEPSLTNIFASQKPLLSEKILVTSLAAETKSVTEVRQNKELARSTEKECESLEKLLLNEEHKESTNEKEVCITPTSKNENNILSEREIEEKLNDNRKVLDIPDRRNTLSDISEDEKCIETPVKDKYMALIESIEQHLSDISDQVNSDDEESALYTFAVCKETMEKSKTQEAEENVKVAERINNDNERRLSDISADEGTGGDDKELGRQETSSLSEISRSRTQEVNRSGPISQPLNNSKLDETPSVLNVTTDMSSKIKSPSAEVATEARQQVSYESLVNDGILAIHDSDTEDFIRKLDKAISGAESISSRSHSQSCKEELGDEGSGRENKNNSTKKRRKHKKRSRRQGFHRELRERSPSNESTDSEAEERLSLSHRSLKRTSHSVDEVSIDESLSLRHRKLRPDSRNWNSRDISDSLRHRTKHRSSSPQEKRSILPDACETKRRSHSPRRESNWLSSPRRCSKRRSPGTYRHLKSRSSRDKSLSPHGHNRHKSPLGHDSADHHQDKTCNSKQSSSQNRSPNQRLKEKSLSPHRIKGKRCFRQDSIDREKSCSPKDLSPRHGRQRHCHRSKSSRSTRRKSERSPKDKSDRERACKDRSTSPCQNPLRRDSKGHSEKYSSSEVCWSSSESTEELFKKLFKAAIDTNKTNAEKPAFEPFVIVIDDDDEEDEQTSKAVLDDEKPKDECCVDNKGIKDEAVLDVVLSEEEELRSIPLSENTCDDQKTAVYEGSEIIGTRRLKNLSLEVEKEKELQLSTVEDVSVVLSMEDPNRTSECNDPSAIDDKEKIEDNTTETIKDKAKDDSEELIEMKKIEKVVSEDNSDDASDLQKVRLKLQTSSSDLPSPVTIDSSSNDGVKKTEKADEWANKGLEELQEIREKLERDMGFKIEDLVQCIQNPKDDEEVEEIHDFPQEDMPEMPSFPNQYFHSDRLFEMTGAPQPVPPPVLPQDMQVTSHQFFSSHTPQGTFDLTTYLDLPPGIKPNDPRFYSRLKLLYNKTRDSRLQESPISREPLLPQPTEFLGTNMLSVAADIRSACLQEISNMPPSMRSSTHHQSQQPSAMSSTPRNPHLARTYGEYKRLKQQALDAEAARRKAAVDAANKALESEIAKPRDPECAQKLQVPSSESIIDKMYRSKTYEADVRPAPGFRIPKKKEESKLDVLENVEDILTAIDKHDSGDDSSRGGKNRRKSFDKNEQHSQRKLSGSRKGEKEKASDLSSDEDVIVKRKDKQARRLSSSSEDEVKLKRNRKLSSSSKQASPSKTRRLSTASRRKNSTVDMSDSDDIYPSNCDLARVSSPVLNSSTESEQENKKTPSKKISLTNIESQQPQTEKLPLKASPEKGLSIIKELIDTIFKSKSKTDASEKALRLLEPFVTPDKLQQYKNIILGYSGENEEAPTNDEIPKEFERESTASPTFSRKDTKDDKIASQSSKKGQFRELDNLHRDIQDMFIKDGLLSISSRRMCSIVSEERTSLQMGKRKVGDKSFSPNSSEDETKHSDKRIKSVQQEEHEKPFHGDEDVDTDDFEEYVKCKTPEKPKQKKKKLAVPVVRLKRLNPKDTLKTIQNIKANKKKEEDAVLLKPMKVIPFSDQEQRKGRKGKPKSKKTEIKNTNADHHIRSNKYNEGCLLCSEKTRNIVNHYVNVHPEKEVFISRMHHDDIKYLNKNPILARRIAGSQKRFSAACIFCDKEIKDTFVNFHDHYSSHTGEYAYECAICDVRRCNKQAILKHCKEQCNDNKFVRNYTYEKNLTKINAYICTKCNYVQLHKANVLKHLRTEHCLPAVYESDVQEVVLVEKVHDDDDSLDIVITNEPISAKQDDAEILFEIETKKARMNDSLEYDNGSNSCTDKADSPCCSPNNMISDNIADTSIAIKAESDPFDDLDRTLCAETTTANKMILEPPIEFNDKSTPIMTMIHLSNASVGVLDKNSININDVNTFLQDSENNEQKPDIQELEKTIEAAAPETARNTEGDQVDEVEEKPDVENLVESLISKTNDAADDIHDIKPDTKELEPGNLDLSVLDQLLNQSSEENLIEVAKESVQKIEKSDIIDMPNDEVAEDCSSHLTSLNFPEGKQSEEDGDVIIIDDDNEEEEGHEDNSKTRENIISGPRANKTEELQKLILKAIADDDDESTERITTAKEEIAENSEQGDDAITVIEVVEEENKVDDDDSFPRLEIDLSEQEGNDLSEVHDSKQTNLDDPTISRIVNIGFQKIVEKQYRYYCLIENCSFLSSFDPEELRIHVRSMHRKHWSGKCNICRRRVLDGVKLPMCLELDHMLKDHIEESTSPAKRAKLTENESESILLTRECVQPRQESLAVPVICILKPWIGTTTSQKPHDLCRAMLDEKSLYCLYKCMGNNCSFSTSSKAGIATHFQHHENPSLHDLSRSWLECSYCDHIGTCSNELIQHVQSIHSSSIFQCSKCFYRSCAAFNVLVHQKLFHSSEDNNLILSCHGKIKSMTAEMPEIFEKRACNVKPLFCEVCKEKFFIKDYLQWHMTTVHQKKYNLKKANVGLYACIYCSSETDDLDLMREHMANLHPSELLYVCGRVVNKESAIQSTAINFSTIESTCLVHVGGIVDKSLIKKCTIKENLLYKTELSFGGEEYLIEPNVVDLTNSEENCSASSSRRSSSTEIMQKYEGKVMKFDELERLLQPTTPVGTTGNFDTKKSEVREAQYKELQRLIKIATRATGITGRKLYVCCIPFCKESYVNASQWENHLRFKHPENPLGTKHKCPHCPETFIVSEFPAHFAQHKTHRYFCYYCGDTFLQASIAEKHLASKHSYISSRITYLLPKDSDDESTHGVLCDPERFFVITAPSVRTDQNSLMEFMIQVLNARYTSKCDKETFTTNRSGGGLPDQRAGDKKSAMKNIDEITIDLNSDLFDESAPVFVKSRQRYVCGYRYCKFRARNEPSFENHFKELHKKMNKFTCVHCKTELANVTSFSRIRDHMRLHADSVFICCMCNGSTYSQIDMTRHMNILHKRVDIPVISYIRSETCTKKRIQIISPKSRIVNRTKTYKCLLCTNKFTDIEMVDHLNQVHEVIVKYQCVHCSFEESREQVEIHVANTHPTRPFRYKSIFHKQGDDDTTTLRRDVAAAEDESSQSSTSSSGTKRHNTVESDGTVSSFNISTKRQKLNNNVFQCAYCQFVTDTIDSLNEHMQINHETTSPPTPSTCSNEGTPKTSVLALKPVQKCDHCMFISDNTSDLDAHVKINHLEEAMVASSSATNITINYDNSSSIPDPIINLTVSFDKQTPLTSMTTTPSEVVANKTVTENVQETPIEPRKSFIRLVPMSKLLRPDIIEASKSQPAEATPMQVIEDEFLDINEPITSDYLHNLLADDKPEYVTTVASNQNPTTAFSNCGNLAAVPTYEPSLNEIIFVCYHCKMKLNKIEGLLNHWREVHCSGEIKLNFKYHIVRKVCCVYCGHGGSFFEMKSHHLTHHAGRHMTICTISNPLRCSECPFYATSGKDELVIHAFNEHNNLINMVASSNFIDQKLLDILLRLGAPSTSYKCKFCNNIYEEKELCISHVQTSHNAAPSEVVFECYMENSLFYGCKLCNILHDHEKPAVQHLRNHTKPYLCSFCPKRFQNYFYLKRHYEIDHKTNESGYKYADIQQNLHIYKDMLLVFPNGLVMTKGELQNTIYGKMTDFLRLIETVEKEELSRYVSERI